MANTDEEIARFREVLEDAFRAGFVDGCNESYIRYHPDPGFRIDREYGHYFSQWIQEFMRKK